MAGPKDPRSEDADVDREAKTPKTSNTFNIYANAAHEAANKLEHFALLMRKQLIPSAHEAADEADVLAAALRSIGERFGAWPTMNPEAVAFEKYELGLPAQLLELRERARLLMGPDKE